MSYISKLTFKLTNLNTFSPQLDLKNGAPIICDTQMVLQGIMSDQRTSQNQILCMIGLPNVKKIATRGPITSDHLIRTKPAPMYIKQKNVEKDIEDFLECFARVRHIRHPLPAHVAPRPHRI